jgi:hypothetical protein
MPSKRLREARARVWLSGRALTKHV